MDPLGCSELRPADDYARMRRLDLLGGLELMRARFVRHAFPRHAHDTYVIEIIESGADAFLCGEQHYRAEVGDIVLINPGEVHTGASADAVPLSYRSFYPTEALMSHVMQAALGGPARPAPRFRQTVVRDAVLARALLGLHESLEEPVDSRVAETALVRVLAPLLRDYGVETSCPTKGAAAHEPIRRTQDFIRLHAFDGIRLEQLARMARLSEYHFLREFRRQVGMPPHEYLISVRIERSKELLRRKRPLVEVAVETGFADQSHFSRCFKRLVGVPPGQFLR